MDVLNWPGRSYRCIKFCLKWKDARGRVGGEPAPWGRDPFARYSNSYMYNYEEYVYV
jgi:hypothetical protein